MNRSQFAAITLDRLRNSTVVRKNATRSSLKKDIRFIEDAQEYLGMEAVARRMCDYFGLDQGAHIVELTRVLCDLYRDYRHLSFD